MLQVHPAELTSKMESRRPSEIRCNVYQDSPMMSCEAHGRKTRNFDGKTIEVPRRPSICIEHVRRHESVSEERAAGMMPYSSSMPILCDRSMTATSSDSGLSASPDGSTHSDGEKCPSPVSTTAMPRSLILPTPSSDSLDCVRKLSPERQENDYMSLSSSNWDRRSTHRRSSWLEQFKNPDFKSEAEDYLLQTTTIDHQYCSVLSPPLPGESGPNSRDFKTSSLSLTVGSLDSSNDDEEDQGYLCARDSGAPRNKYEYDNDTASSTRQTEISSERQAGEIYTYLPSPCTNGSTSLDSDVRICGQDRQRLKSLSAAERRSNNRVLFKGKSCSDIRENGAMTNRFSREDTNSQTGRRVQQLFGDAFASNFWRQNENGTGSPTPSVFTNNSPAVTRKATDIEAFTGTRSTNRETPFSADSSDGRTDSSPSPDERQTPAIGFSEIMKALTRKGPFAKVMIIIVLAIIVGQAASVAVGVVVGKHLPR